MYFAVGLRPFNVIFFRLARHYYAYFSTRHILEDTCYKLPLVHFVSNANY